MIFSAEIPSHLHPSAPAGNAVASYLSWLFSPQDYMPHGMCFLWQPELIALHVASDAAIAAAYYSIPFALIYFVSKRIDIVFPGVFLLTGAFILACGTTHIMSIWTLWQPDYRFDGIVKLFTALVSVATAVAMWRTMPFALALPSTAQLEQANRSLAGEIAARESAQVALRDMNAELERRVAQRTAELQEEIVQRKRSEDALRQNEVYLAEAQRISRTGSFGWNAASGENIWSEETYRIFEFDRTIKPTMELVLLRTHLEDRDRVRQLLERVSHDGKDWDIETRLLMPDGSVKFVHAVAHPMKNESGNLEFVGAVKNITAARQAEERLNQVQAELARISRVTTLGELTAAIAHEVNQPLTGLVNSANACLRWLAGDPPNIDAARRSIQRMVKDGSRAGEVIGRIRAMVRKSPPRKDSLNINDMIVEVIALVPSEIQRNNISLKTTLSEDVPLVLGDRIQLQQVILNLLMNAIEAMSGTSQIHRDLSIISVKEGSNAVLVEVRDSGPGFDVSASDRIFEAFYTTKADGMGMGLAISRTIIRAHGGQLWAAPNIPRGARFSFMLPAEDKEMAFS